MIKTQAMLCGLILALCWPGVSRAAEDEKLLFGFEKEECEKAAAAAKLKNGFKALPNGDCQMMPPLQCEGPDATGGLMPMECVQKEASQGKLALKVPNSTCNKAPFPSHWLYVNPKPNYLGLAMDPRVNLRTPELLNTSGWFAGAFPEDWSGWDLLRVDVKPVHDRPVTIMVEIEDDLVEPPVSQTYEGVKPGEWTTLELDLGKAVEERKLNPKKMCNIFVRFDGRKDLKELGGYANKRKLADTLAVYLDNIRLAKKGAVCKTPVLAGERSSYTRELPRSYAAELLWDGQRGVTIAKEPMPKPAKLSSEAEAVTLSAPAVIDLPPLLKKGYRKSDEKGVTEDNLHQFVVLKAVTAASSKAIIVCFGTPAIAKSMPFDKPTTYQFCPMVAVTTSDGGKTWGGFKGPGEVPTWIHNGRKAWEGTVFDAGADLMGLKDDGCITWRDAWEYYPCDRVYLWRTVYTSDGWKESPVHFVSGDSRWCMHAAQNVLRLPSGRLWCTFGTRGRRGGEVWVRHSDDEGATWHGWRGPGLLSTVPLKGSGTAGSVRGELFPYGEHVGMITNGGSVRQPGQWTFFDGKAWTEPAEMPAKNPAQVAACGRDVFVVDQNGPLIWYDGQAWKPLTLPGREEGSRLFRQHGNSPGAPEWAPQQYFSVCGEAVLYVEADKTGRKLLCWRRPRGGAWAGPQELVSEETPIADLAAPRYGLPGFTPVAYNCWSGEERNTVKAGGSIRFAAREIKPWIKVLKVPAGK
jgi:hypothetical protein